MTIGLSTEQLFTVATTSFQQRWSLWISGVSAASAGESPELKKSLEANLEYLKKAVPNADPPTVATLGILINTFSLSLMDAVVANNKEIEKSVPHLG